MTDPTGEEESLALSHDDVVTTETRAEVEALSQRLSQVPFDSERGREQSGAALVKALRTGRPPAGASGGVEGLGPVAAQTCRALPSPSFSLESPQSGSDTTYSRADRQTGTLEIQARIGTFAGTEYRSGDESSFLVPYNSAAAWIGAEVPIPRHGSRTHATLTILEVSVELLIERVWPGNLVEQGTGSDMVFVGQGAGDLPLRGVAAAWCRAGLAIYGSGGAHSRASAEISSAWTNRDGSDSEDHAPSGRLSLQHAVAISRDLNLARVFVDIACLAAAEIDESDKWRSAYAHIHCRTGGFSPTPCRVRVDPGQVRIRLCEMPSLTEKLDVAPVG